jgi:hypothetical protein
MCALALNIVCASFAGKVQMPSKEVLADQLKQAKLDYFAKKLDLTQFANRELDPWDVAHVVSKVLNVYGKQVDLKQYQDAQNQKYAIIKALLQHSPQALEELDGFI